jgi:hypothetical protein
MDVAGNLPGMQLAGKVLGNSATVQGYKRLVDAGTSADIDMANNIKDLAGNAYNKYAQAEKDSLTGLVDGITGTTRAVGNAISDNVDSLSKNIGSGIHQRMDGLGRRASEVMDSLKPMKDPALKMGRVMGPRVDPTQLNALPFYGPSAPPYMSPASAGNHGTNNTLRDIADTAVHGGELGLGVTLVRKGMLPYINRKDVAAGRAPTFS